MTASPEKRSLLLLVLMHDSGQRQPAQRRVKMKVANIQVWAGGKIFDIYDDNGSWVGKFSVPASVPDDALDAVAIMEFQGGGPIGEPGRHAVRLNSQEGVLVNPNFV